MKDIAEDRLLILARAASRRLEEANAALHDAEREKRIAWQDYDDYVDGKRSTSDASGVEKP